LWWRIAFIFKQIEQKQFNYIPAGTLLAMQQLVNDLIKAPKICQLPQPALSEATRVNDDSPRLGFTTAPIKAGDIPGIIPEFCRMKTATIHTGLSRSKIYQGINEGWVHSVSLRKSGQKFSVRLIHLPSLIDFLRAKMEEQGGIETQRSNSLTACSGKLQIQ
jgi:hypothetical protein